MVIKEKLEISKELQRKINNLGKFNGQKLKLIEGSIITIILKSPLENTDNMVQWYRNVRWSYMSEKDLDSSMNPYQEKIKPKGYIKQLQWDMAIGLQQVDNLTPSKYLKQISEKNILGELTIKEVEQSLKEYYTTKEKQKDINNNELECDFISMRMAELLD